jgi:protein TonB
MPAPYHVKVALRFARDGFGNGRVTDATGESDVEAPRKIHDVPPEYPSAAQAKKLAGVVVIEAVVNQNGEVTGATVKTSVAPLLDAAALAAVRQWRYTPALKNGQPVEVIITVTVSFSLR